MKSRYEEKYSWVGLWLFRKPWIWTLSRLADYYHELTGKKYYVIENSRNRFKIHPSPEIGEHNRIHDHGKIPCPRLYKDSLYQTKSN